MTISELTRDFQENYMYRRLKPTTIRGYNRNIEAYILPNLSEKHLDEITYQELDALVEKIGSLGLSNTSIIYVLATLSKMYSYAVKRSYTKVNPLLTYDYPRRKKYQYFTLSICQIESLLKYARSFDEFPAILLACHYGLRRGECCGLHPSDLAENILQIRRTASEISGRTVTTTTKNDKIRFVKLADEDAAALRSYDLEREPSPHKFLIRRADGSKLSANVINKRLRKHLEFLKLPVIRFHDLRHSYATIMMQNGVNPKIVSTVLGHSSVDITLDLYSHCSVEMQEVCLQVFRKPKK